MKKLYTALLCVAAFSLSKNASAQTYSAWGVTPNGADYDTIVTNGDPLNFSFSGIQLGGHGNARLVVYREGDYGDMVEYLDVTEDGTATLLGTVGSTGTDCAPEDSTDILFDATQIDTWQSGGILNITLTPSFDVDLFCMNNRAKVRLVYDYCAFGTPSEYADFSFASLTTCNTAAPIAMTGTPVGGTYSGTGVSGNAFDPDGLVPGKYDVTYTATDGIGCVTSETETITILSSPNPVSELVCEGSTPVFNTSPIQHGYFTDLAMTNALDTADVFTFPAVTTTPTNYYYAVYDIDYIFTLDTIENTNAAVVDHDAITSDDRSGIALTDSTVYIVGDGATARYDLDMLTPPAVLPVMDGLVTDLRLGKIYSLYSAVDGMMTTNPGLFTVDGIIALDANLASAGDTVLFSQSFDVNYGMDQTGIFSGYGEFIINSGEDGIVYVIDFDNGAVEALGSHPMNHSYSENWAYWGVAGFDGVDRYVYYRDNFSDNILAHNLATDATNYISNLPYMSDMACFILNPFNDRMYFHYEGSGGFGGSFETFGYTDASYTAIAPAGSFSCPAPIEFTFSVVDLGPDTTVCQEDGYVIEPGLGYESYTWNGLNNNWNVYPVSSSGTYTVDVVDASGCVISDAITVTMEWCSLGAEETAPMTVTAYPVPNNGLFNLNFGAMVDNLNLEVYDLQGKLVYSALENGTVSMLQLDLTHLESGMYVVALKADQGSTRIPVTIQK